VETAVRRWLINDKDFYQQEQKSSISRHYKFVSCGERYVGSEAIAVQFQNAIIGSKNKETKI
jgi:hypothetical protein